MIADRDIWLRDCLDLLDLSARNLSQLRMDDGGYILAMGAIMILAQGLL